jgi:hypothetical protein
MRLGWLLALWLCWLCAAPAWSKDYYVNNVVGNDRNDGESPQFQGGRTGPFRTIERALEVTTGGDRVILEKTAEPYRESITLQAARHSGIPTVPFEIIGNGAVLDGSMPVPLEAWERYGETMYRFRAERKSSHILFLDGKPATRRRFADNVETIPDLEVLEWCLHEGQVYFRPEPGKLPWSYELTHTVLPVGLTLYEVRHVIVQDLVVQGFSLDGVNAHDGAVEVQLLGLTCRGNGRSGISVGGASRARIEACLVGDNGESQIRTEGFCRVRLVNCDLIDHPAAPAVDQQGGDVVVESRVARASVSDEPVQR